MIDNVDYVQRDNFLYGGRTNGRSKDTFPWCTGLVNKFDSVLPEFHYRTP